jgi:hypothetical protein
MNLRITGLLKNILNFISCRFSHNITHKNQIDSVKGMGVKQDIDSILENLKEQPPAIHDLKLKFNAENLYEILNNGTRNVNPRNKGIILDSLLCGSSLAKISVYPKSVHIDLGCTFVPYSYSYRGGVELRKTLEEIRKYLAEQIQNRAKLPPVGEWNITQYHFGKDGKEELSGYSFMHTWEEIEGGMKRFYSKHMPDGRVIPRLEQIRTPNHTIDEETELMIMSPLIKDL